ncbi:MAG: hypothetical protein A3G24_12710 [Betaproteobacteria bacterium RIFCSPLOWO2_12_FULL_62_13]|nr:MAG: hypothetical protein A3G24_12710 [Betaproteobacteria bacterium RIFCSPLOWO2_12_FULL_62_13]
MFDGRSLDALFRPRSIAVVGASSNPNKIGGRPLVFLRQAGYAGAIYPVNPGAGEVQGLRSFQSISDIDKPIDHVIIAVPPREAIAAMKQCAAKKVKAVQVFTSGFGETGESGRKLQDELVATAKDAGIRLIGPNSLGLFNVPEKFFGTFATVLDGAWPTAGNVSFASQSGGFGSLCYVLAQARGLGFSHFITTGNETDVDVAECIAYLADDKCTHVIVAAFEGCRDGRRLIAALEVAHGRGKPVILMKVGTTEAGANAVQTHTGALAGRDAIYDAAFRQFNAYRAHSLDELVDCTYAASRGRLPRGSRLGVVTFSGGVGVLAADAAAEHELELPPLDKTAGARIKSILPNATVGNPLDTSAALVNDLSLYARIVEIVLEETSCDMVFGYLAAVGRNPQHYAQLKGPLFEVRRRYPDKLFVLTMACPEEVREELEREGFLWFEEPARAVAAAAAMAKLAKGLESRRAALGSAPRITLPRGPLSEIESKAVVAQAGISFLPERFVQSANDACETARQLGFPVAIKVVSRDIPHKSDIGGVRLDLRDDAQVAAAFDEIMQAVACKIPQARVDGVLVTPMVRGGVETILGVMRDSVFGPVVMFGLGGAYVEALKDVSFRVAPFDIGTARDMISETMAGRVLKGIRGAVPADVESLAATLARLSVFACANADVINGIDVNPYVVVSNGGYALDALVVPT